MEDDAEPPVDAVFAPVVELVVPAIALVGDAVEPDLDVLNEKPGAEAGGLGEVAEFVGEHAGELAEGEALGERQADGEAEVVGEEATPSPMEAGARVDGEVDVDGRGWGRADAAAEGFDEGEEFGLFFGLYREAADGLGAGNEEGFEQEEGDDGAYDGRGEDEADGEPVDLDGREDDGKDEYVGDGGGGCAENEGNVNGLQEEEGEQEAEQGEAVAPRGPDGFNGRGEGLPNLFRCQHSV